MIKSFSRSGRCSSSSSAEYTAQMVVWLSLACVVEFLSHVLIRRSMEKLRSAVHEVAGTASSAFIRNVISGSSVRTAQYGIRLHELLGIFQTRHLGASFLDDVVKHRDVYLEPFTVQLIESFDFGE